MNTKDSYLFTDLEIAKEAADYQAIMFGNRTGVIRSPVNHAQYIVTRNYAMFELTKVLYVSEAPNG